MVAQVFALIMLIPFSIFLINGIRAGFTYILNLSAEPFHIFASGSPFSFYLLETVVIVGTLLFLRWAWNHYLGKINWWLTPVFFVGIIGSIFTGIYISGLANLNGLQYQGCGAHLGNDFNVAVEKQDISFCSNPHDYARVNTYEGLKGGDFCFLPGGNTVGIIRTLSNEFDPIFSAGCFEALAVQTKQPELCLKTKSSDRTPDVHDGVVDCIQNYARRDKDIASCELLTRDERNRCIYLTAVYGIRSIKKCEAIDTDSVWKGNCLNTMIKRSRWKIN